RTSGDTLPTRVLSATRQQHSRGHAELYSASVRNLIPVASLGVTGLLFLHACVDSRRTPTTPSAVATGIADMVSWACGRLGHGQSDGGTTNGWIFEVPACAGGSSSAQTLGGLGIITTAPTGLHATVADSTVLLEWTAVPDRVTGHVI